MAVWCPVPYLQSMHWRIITLSNHYKSSVIILLQHVNIMWPCQHFKFLETCDLFEFWGVSTCFLSFFFLFWKLCMWLFYDAISDLLTLWKHLCEHFCVNILVCQKYINIQTDYICVFLLVFAPKICSWTELYTGH